jgi:flavodoxin
MKTIVLCTSVHHGNTKKVAAAIAKAMNAEVMDFKKADKDLLLGYDQIGFGSGIFFKKHHKDVFSFVDSLPKVTGKKAFVFSTSGTGTDEFNEPLKLALKEKNFEISGSFACEGYDTWGPFKLVGGIAKGKPDEEDLENAAAFARSLI